MICFCIPLTRQTKIVVGDSYFMLFYGSIIVFAITLILTKSKILAQKREFIQNRYKSAKVDNMRPGFIHSWWHAMFTCPMCSGFWISIVVANYMPVNGLIADTLVLFGLNWLWHCLENFLYQIGKFFLDNKNFMV